MYINFQRIDLQIWININQLIFQTLFTRLIPFYYYFAFSTLKWFKNATGIATPLCNAYQHASCSLQDTYQPYSILYLQHVEPLPTIPHSSPHFPEHSFHRTFKLSNIPYSSNPLLLFSFSTGVSFSQKLQILRSYPVIFQNENKNNLKNKGRLR